LARRRGRSPPTARAQTRYQQLDDIRAAFGFADLSPARRREIGAWLLLVALATTSAASIAAALLDELRRRRLIVSATSVVRPRRSAFRGRRAGRLAQGSRRTRRQASFAR
jgi:hypothetical protein